MKYNRVFLEGFQRSMCYALITVKQVNVFSCAGQHEALAVT